MKNGNSGTPEERAKGVKLLLLDVDGVLTDGRIVYSSSGNELKFFDVKDGHGIKLIQRAGIMVGIITGRTSEIVRRRAEELGITLLYQGRFEKSAVLAEIVNKTGIIKEHIAFVGDDLVDIPVLKRVGFGASVSDAVTDVKEVAHYVSSFPGGRGAVRDIVEFILRNKGLWNSVIEKYQD